jgi:hypothetical protein
MPKFVPKPPYLAWERIISRTNAACTEV